MTDEAFIELHRHDDVRSLALQKAPEGVDLKHCLQQIEGWQLAAHKIPRWASTQGILFPPRLSLEQCSSEATAQYKTAIAKRLIPETERTKMADFTGGMGVDFSFLSVFFGQATYLECDAHLCSLAEHNLPLLGLPEARILCGEIDADSPLLNEHYSLIFLDPARRDSHGRKMVMIEDCTPDVTQLNDRLLGSAAVVMLKFSPMLDITSALRSLRGVREVHTVSVKNECKELLLVMSRGEGVTYHCVNLGSADPDFILSEEELRNSKIAHFIEELPAEGYLFEPNASILKAGVQDALCGRFPLAKLHPHSHLFYSPEPLPQFPGRSFRIAGWSDFGKKGLKRLLTGVGQANLTLRNFPSTTAELRRRLALAEGGDTYLFATTDGRGRHILVRCERD